ncbi:Protein MAM3 [Trichinella pseudospiralis]
MEVMHEKYAGSIVLLRVGNLTNHGLPGSIGRSLGGHFQAVVVCLHILLAFIGCVEEEEEEEEAEGRNRRRK